MAKKNYEVLGHEVLGHPRGSVVELDLTDEQETYYLEGGHLAKSQKKTAEGEPHVTPAHQRAAEEAARAAALREGETQTPGEQS